MTCNSVNFSVKFFSLFLFSFLFVLRSFTSMTVELRYNEPLYNKVLGVRNDFLYPSNSKLYGKEPRYNENSLLRTYFASPLALSYIEVLLHE